MSLVMVTVAWGSLRDVMNFQKKVLSLVMITIAWGNLRHVPNSRKKVMRLVMAPVAWGMSLGEWDNVHLDLTPLWTRGLGCAIAGCIPHDLHLGSSREVGLTFVWSLVVQSYWNRKSIEFHLVADMVT